MIACRCFPLYVDPMKLNFYLILRSFRFRCPAGMVGLYNANDVPAQRRQTHKHKPGSCDGKVNINVGASEHDEW